MDRFVTPRLIVAPWRDDLADSAARARLGADLEALLTPPITRRLPPDMAHRPGRDDMDAWIDARDRDAQTFTVRLVEAGALAGLLFLHPRPSEDGEQTLMIGYFLGEQVHGRGLGSELIGGLVAAHASGPATRLVAGVDADNLASLRVLEKAGFTPDVGAPAGRFFYRLCGTT